MKISQEKSEFKPITIVLETLKEAQEMEFIMGEFSRGRYGISDVIYDYLKERRYES